MKNESNIIITGAAGFIGSCLVSFLNEKKFFNLILVDDFSEDIKYSNLTGKKFLIKIERNKFFNWLENTQLKCDFVFHIGARTDTTEFDYAIHEELNLNYSKLVWQYCAKQNIPLVYASSAATYGSGEFGYDDDHKIISSLQPLNPYGVSKNEFDKWVIQQTAHNNHSSGTGSPPFWAGLKFFNVYGPNEYHKGRMASVIFHAFNQVQTIEKVKLFKSHRNDFEDGNQLRDFIYVKDVLDVCYWLMEHQPTSAIYNVGPEKHEHSKTWQLQHLLVCKKLQRSIILICLKISGININTLQRQKWKS